MKISARKILKGKIVEVTKGATTAPVRRWRHRCYGFHHQRGC